MRIYIIGPANSGKSSAARFLGQALKLPVFETGELVKRELEGLYVDGKRRVYDESGTVQRMADVRLYAEGRQPWIRNLMTRLKPAVLVDRCVKVNQPGIVVGVEYKHEYEALTTEWRDQQCPSVWIRVNRLEHDSRGFCLNDVPVDHDVLNITLKGLKFRMDRIAAKLKTKRLKNAA